jgi:hypothetical protein
MVSRLLAGSMLTSIKEGRTMNYSLRKKLLFLGIAMCLASFIAGVAVSSAADSKPVIGKAFVKKGTELGGVVFMNVNGAWMPAEFIFKAVKDQILYVTKKVPPLADTHNGGYILIGDGFAHDCPHHGEEIMEKATIGLPTEQVGDGIAKDGTLRVKVELF